ncbi:MAG: DNA helicase RecQ [Oscillospiraceae bacterium]|nr:DNA helicase RecQ [Oscillospiraceae bacterium]
MDKLELLRQRFGYDAFRPGQQPLIDALLQGRDVLGVMPTGAGKSICYQLPALLLPGLTIVISPLISLMKDQVAALTQLGIPSAFLNSTLDAQSYCDVLRGARRGAYKLLYVAPERLEADRFQELAQDIEISLAAVDEAHCVSQWGQDFRPGYLKIAAFLDALPRRPAVGAFTATATAQVRDDIERLLGLREPLRVTTGFDRPNLFFDVVRPKSKDAYLRQFLSERPRASGIVYCATRKKVEAVCDGLQRHGFSATRYHAGLSDQERLDNQERFVYDEARIMVATNAFGMGIDKSNVGFVVHYNMPKNMESYYQEAGRAGRDGSPARCVLLYAPGDVQTARFLIQNGEDNELVREEERELLRQRDLDRLDQMTAYCKTTGCLRACILRYFGERAPERCGSCGNCSGALEERDITVEAQKILSGVARVEKRFPSSLGVSSILDMLRGSRSQKVRHYALDELSTYGIMKDISRDQVRTYIDLLIQEGYLCLTAGTYPVLRLCPSARQVLFHGEKVTCLCRVPTDAELAAGKRETREKAPAAGAEALYERLRELRGRLAHEANVPAYVVFSNVTLADMAAKRPATPEAFLDVSGVGEFKAQKYATPFLAEIAAWLEEEEAKV